MHKPPHPALHISFIQSAENIHIFKVNSDKQKKTSQGSSTQTWRQSHNYINLKANPDCDCFILYQSCGLHKSKDVSYFTKTQQSSL